jgi:hypothetical protein
MKTLALRRFLVLAAGLLLLDTTYAPPARAFGVDVCFNSPTSGELPVRNCIGVEQICRTSNLTAPQAVGCRVAATGDSLSGLTGGNAIIGARSLLHSDSTYLMAQLLGYTPWQAYQVMIYDEATDQSDYVPFDQRGTQMLSDAQVAECRAQWGPAMPRHCLVITRVMNGIYKFNDASGGMLLHLHARYSPNGAAPPAIGYPADYLAPPHAAYEPLLSNLRDWVFDLRPDACVAGLLLPGSAGGGPLAPCERADRVLDSPASFFAAGVSRLQIPFQSRLGRLVVNADESSTVTAEDRALQAFVHPHDMRFAKPGIFLHSLADRYSHHLCTDRSYFFRKSSGNYDSRYAQVACAQGSHFLWHAWEQGTRQDTGNLAPEYQTLRPALEAVHGQLLAYARLRGLPVNTSISRQAIVDELIEVLQVFQPQARLDAMVALMERHGALPLPGHGSVAQLPIERWLERARVATVPPDGLRPGCGGTGPACRGSSRAGRPLH